MKAIVRVTAFAAALIAAPALAAGPTKPTLVVAISVDQFSADLFAEYRALFKDGLKRLVGGVVFPSGFQGHAATETCPGHSTILTGDRPARTGIIANSWDDMTSARPDKRIYCAEDELVPGTTASSYSVSAVHLRVPTLGDRLKVANPASRVVSVAGKDRAAVMMGGHDVDQLWFWGSKSYVTLAGHTSPVPAIIDSVNARAAAQIARPTAVRLPPVCESRVRSVAAGSQTVGTAPVRTAGDAKAFRATPE